MSSTCVFITFPLKKKTRLWCRFVCFDCIYGNRRYLTLPGQHMTFFSCYLSVSCSFLILLKNYVVYRALRLNACAFRHAQRLIRLIKNVIAIYLLIVVYIRKNRSLTSTNEVCVCFKMHATQGTWKNPCVLINECMEWVTNYSIIHFVCCSERLLLFERLFCRTSSMTIKYVDIFHSNFPPNHLGLLAPVEYFFFSSMN